MRWPGQASASSRSATASNGLVCTSDRSASRTRSRCAGCAPGRPRRARSPPRSAGVTVDVRAHHQDVARLQRGVVDQQAEQHLPQHVDLPGRAVAAVHLHRPVIVPQRASLRATGIRSDIGLQPAQQGVGPAGAAEELVGGDRGGQAALQLAQVAPEGGQQGWPTLR